MQLLIPAIHHQQLLGVKNYFSGQGIVLNIFSGPAQLEPSRGILILQPLVSPAGYLDTYHIWSFYLKKYYPSARLFVLGIEASNGAVNYIDLLNLPAELNTIIKDAKQVKEDWAPPITAGLDLLKKLQYFLVGHGDHSIVQALGRVNSKFAWLKNEIGQQTEEKHRDAVARLERKAFGKNEMLKAWKGFKYRWNLIQPLLPYFPFVEEMKPIGQKIEALDPYFLSDLENGSYFIKNNCVEHFDELHTIIRTLNQKYGPEPTPHPAGRR